MCENNRIQASFRILFSKVLFRIYSKLFFPSVMELCIFQVSEEIRRLKKQKIKKKVYGLTRIFDYMLSAVAVSGSGLKFYFMRRIFPLLFGLIEFRDDVIRFFVSIQLIEWYVLILIWFEVGGKGQCNISIHYEEPIWKVTWGPFMSDPS